MSEKGGGTQDTWRKRKEPEHSDVTVNRSLMRSLVECPVCMEVFAGKVFQCRDGHVICEKCKSSLAAPTRCPSCRGSLNGDIRNRVLETMAEQAEVACGLDGCGFRGLNKGIAEHRKACEHRPYTCPLPNCKWEGGLDDVEEHLVQKHGTVKLQCPDTGCITRMYTNPNGVESRVWSNVFSFKRDKYLLCCKLDATAKAYKLCVLQMSLNSSHQGEYTLMVSGNSRKQSSSGMIPRLRDHSINSVFDSGGDFLHICERTANLISTGRPDAALNEMKFSIVLQIH